MNNDVLLSATVAVAVLSGAASVTAQPMHKPSTVLWNQNSNFSGGVNSQNYTSGSNGSADDAAADDFIVPKGKRWKVGEVDVSGLYFNGSGPAKSEDITFYKDDNGLPGKPVKKGAYTRVSCNDAGGSFSCMLPKTLKLTSGHYWVSVVANCSYAAGCEWGWMENTVVQGEGAVWEQGGGPWTRISPSADLAFTLIGKP